MLTDLIPYIDEILIYVSIASIIVVFALPWRIKAKGQLGKTVKNPEAFELHITLYKGLMGVCLFAQSGRIQAHFLAFSFICKRFSIAVYPNPFSKQLDYSPNNNSLRKKNEYDQYDDNQQSDDHTNANQSKKRSTKLSNSDLLLLVLSPGITLLRNLPRVIYFYRLSINGELGLTNPLHTGLLYGLQQAILHFECKRLSIDVLPIFHTCTYNCKLKVDTALHLGLLLLLGLRFALHTGCRYILFRVRLSNLSGS